jgi:hypothetical protein
VEHLERLDPISFKSKKLVCTVSVSRTPAWACAEVSAAPRVMQSFEVASVKPNRAGDRRVSFPRLQNGTFTATNTPLKNLLAVAYEISGLRIAGPDWLDTERFDIAAKAPQGFSIVKFA